MLVFIGAYFNNGIYYCETCGLPMSDWEKMSTEPTEKGVTYVFRCRKCKKRIEAFNAKPEVDQV